MAEEAETGAGASNLVLNIKKRTRTTTTGSGNSTLAQLKQIESDPYLVQLTSNLLPSNYNFEISKTIWRIRRVPNCSLVALQMPEGLLLFATKIGHILRSMTGVDVLLMGDVTYGACCIDDYTASMLGASLLIHYGHSCLVPTSTANLIETMYVFVTIHFDISHSISAIQQLVADKYENTCKSSLVQKKSIKIVQEDSESQDEQSKPVVKISLVSTIQFALSLQGIKEALEADKKLVVNIPRSKPLSQGEILGCTAPKCTNDEDLIIYIGDGRFHLEAMMMANPNLLAYKYDPYNKVMTHEGFDHGAQKTARHGAIVQIFNNTTDKKKKKLTIGLILGTLGRQGNMKPVQYLYDRLATDKDYRIFIICMSEVLPSKLNLFRGAVDAWVQFACPRLSLDWGSAFQVPLLTPYEAVWGLITNKQSTVTDKGNADSYDVHPMDYYAYNSLGPHTPNFIPTVITTKT